MPSDRVEVLSNADSGVCFIERVNPVVFFATSPEEVAAAKEYCGRCGIRGDCLQFAMERPDMPYMQLAIFGGKTDSERERLRRDGYPDGPDGQVA